MSGIQVINASDELHQQSLSWQRWQSEGDSFAYSYDQAVEFIVHAGRAVITDQHGQQYAIQAGCQVRIDQGVEGNWAISDPIDNRYRYLDTA